MNQKAGYTDTPPTYEAACQAAPAEEPERQLYFAELRRAWVEKKKQTEERFQGTFHIQTFGCQVNPCDSEKLTDILGTIECRETDEECADFVLYNTRTMREDASQRIYGRLGYSGTMRKRSPYMAIALCGCMMQEPEVVEKMKKNYRFVDLVSGARSIFKLAELLYQRFGEQKPVADVWEGTGDTMEDLPSDRKFLLKSGVNIMSDCNSSCNYCVVPHMRGRGRNRGPRDTLDGIKRLVTDGMAKAILLGQDVDSYGKTLETPITFAELLRQVEEIKGLERIRFMTSHSKDLSGGLIEVMKQSKKICSHLHLPLQSGNTKVSKETNWRYIKGQSLALAKKIQAAIPDISLTTDITVGFPGETEEDFQDTTDAVRKVRFDSAFTFIYSEWTRTPATSMEDRVPEDVAKERFDRLLAEVQSIPTGLSGRDAHTIQPALVEGLDDYVDGLVTGRMGNNTVVCFPGDVSLVGKIVNVYLEEPKEFCYMGHLAQRDSRPLPEIGGGAEKKRRESWQDYHP